MDYIHREIRRKGVTLRLLWEEYFSEHPEGYRHTQFCEYYSRWKKTLHPTMRLPHKAGEKMFVDWAGQTIPVINPLTGTSSPAGVFVAALEKRRKLEREAELLQIHQTTVSQHIRYVLKKLRRVCQT